MHATYDLSPVTVTPWAAPAPRDRAPVRWHRVGREVCLIAGLLAFIACTITLRLSLYPQSAVSSRTAVLVTLAAGIAGIGALFGAHWFHEASARAAIDAAPASPVL